MAGMVIRPLTPADWPMVEQLFGSTGACGGCWCMHWHAPPGEAEWQRMKGEPNRLALKEEVEAGKCHASLLIDGDRAAGWCRIGPVGSFSRLLRSRLLVREDMADWAVVCFFIAPHQRRSGNSVRLLRAAAALAFDSGARSIEGYPVVPRKAGAIPPPFAWTGLAATFERAGFRPVDHESGSRRIYRLDSELAASPD